MINTALFLSAALTFLSGAQEPVPTQAEPVAAGSPSTVTPLPEPQAVEADTIISLTAEGSRRAQAWFAGMDTLRARFTQIAPDGGESAGDIALQRPGLARFDYDDPSPILVVADGSTVAIADFDLETVDRAPIGATPLRYLLGGPDEIGRAVSEAGRSEGRLYVTLTDPEGEAEGRLTLVFADPDPQAPAETMTLEGWYAVDAMGGLTEVSLTGLERGLRLDPRLFVLDDEDVRETDRRRGR